VAAAVARYGERLASLLPTCRVWLNGEMATLDSPVSADDELAVLPPVSGG
jgi:molybdopterin converting factor small subunit